jgi:hypothetical protein
MATKELSNHITPKGEGDTTVIFIPTLLQKAGSEMRWLASNVRTMPDE